MEARSEAVRMDPLLVTARALEVDRVTGEVVHALRAAGVTPLLLKGPALVAWLYDDGTPRPYVDCDLLVPPADWEKAQHVLSSIGFERDTSLDEYDPRFAPRHADPWKRASDGGQIDLHQTLPGCPVNATDLWGPISADAETMKVGATQVAVPRPAARALIVAAHAGHHGPDEERPIEDLSRAIERVPQATWAEAVEIAYEVQAMQLLSRGLRLLPEGARLAERLGIPSPELIEASYGEGLGGGTALGFARLAEQRGARAKARLLLRELFPEPRFMRWWSPMAARGRLGLALAYAWRVCWLVVHAGPGLYAWARSRKATRERSA
jgi:hypothetical protein